MNEIKWDYIGDKLKNILASKKTKIALYIAAVLWVAVAAQVVVNKAFREELEITEAFIKSDTEEMQSSLEIIAEYDAESLEDQEKKDIIRKLADSIGLTIDEEITVWEEENRSEYLFFKQAKQATTELKVISIDPKENGTEEAEGTKHFIIVRLSIKQGIRSIDGYKKALEGALAKLKVKDKQITVKYEGTKEGDLTARQKHEIAELLVNELQGKIALEYDEGDLYTVYAYTGMLKEYVTTMGTNINIQIAITYNELTNKTKIALASPVLIEDY